jgi:phosphotransferase system HPr-like phosphotransfer protein
MAAAGVVVIDFVSNWLLKRLRGPASKVAGKIREIAKKIGKKIKKALKKVKRKLSKVKEKLFGKKRGKGDKKQKSESEKNKDLNQVAKKTARAGWNKARDLTKAEVKQEGEVKAALNNVQVPHPTGVKVKLDLINAGSTWKVKAIASSKGKQATSTEGNGWIAKGEGGSSWYAAKNNEALHKRIARETAQKLKGAGSTSSSSNNLKQSYQNKLRLGQELQQEGQQRLDRDVKGIKYTIKMEDFSGVEKDKAIKTQLQIRPNATEIQIDVALENSLYVDIALKLRQKAQDVRAEYIIKSKEDDKAADTGNVAVAVVRVQTDPGLEITDEGTSKERPMPIPTGNNVKFPAREDVKGTQRGQQNIENLKQRREQISQERAKLIETLENQLPDIEHRLEEELQRNQPNSPEVIELRKERSAIKRKLDQEKQKQGQPDRSVLHQDPTALNNTHPEYKIFNSFAIKLQQYCDQHNISPGELEGILHLYTEREMCTGCKLTADGDKESFEAMFPKINVVVFYTYSYRVT